MTRDEPTEVTDYHPSDGDVDEKERAEKFERINVIRLQTALGGQLFDVAEQERVPETPAHGTKRSAPAPSAAT